MGFGGMGMMDRFFFGGGFEIMFFLMFGLFFVVFIGALLSGLRTWNRNNHSPRLTVEATVVTKREQLHRGSRRNGHSGLDHYSYYATFEVESGDRMELAVDGREFGMLVEGDKGELTFQGTRYLGFERHR